LTDGVYLDDNSGAAAGVGWAGMHRVHRAAWIAGFNAVMRGLEDYELPYERATHYEQLNYEMGRLVATAARLNACPVVLVPAQVVDATEGPWIDFLHKCSSVAAQHGALPLTAVAG